MMIIQYEDEVRIYEDDIDLDIRMPKKYARLLRAVLNSEELCD